MNIVLLGGPGAGKGTLAKQLRDAHKYDLLSPGELYRREAELKTEFGLRAKAYWGDGNLCPDEMTNELVTNTINGFKIIGTEGIIFDGYPRTLDQAQYLDTVCNIELVLDLDADEHTIVQRLLRRKEIENRSDDTQDIIKQRLNVYHTNNAPIAKYYQGDRYKIFDANSSIESTLKLAEAILLNHIVRAK